LPDSLQALQQAATALALRRAAMALVLRVQAQVQA